MRCTYLAIWALEWCIPRSRQEFERFHLANLEGWRCTFLSTRGETGTRRRSQTLCNKCRKIHLARYLADGYKQIQINIERIQGYNLPLKSRSEASKYTAQGALLSQISLVITFLNSWAQTKLHRRTLHREGIGMSVGPRMALNRRSKNRMITMIQKMATKQSTQNPERKFE